MKKFHIFSKMQIFVLNTALFILVTACSIMGRYSSYQYQVPLQTEDGWQTASLDEVGMDTERIATFMNDLASYPDHWIHGVLVIKDGKLVFEEYFQGRDLDLSDLDGKLDFRTEDFDRETLHSAASVTKSVTAVLMGIAIDQGLIAGTDENLFSFFPDCEHLNDPVKSQITLAHMLSMGSGLPWTEAYSYDDPRNDLTAMISSEDPIAYVLQKETVADPGQKFIYNSGTTNLLGEIIRRKSGMTLADYAEQYLFAPLDIYTYEWYPFPSKPEMMVASSTLYLRPRDMAKIGQLYLDGGMWQGTKVVSEDWVSQSTRKVIGMVASESPIPTLNPAYGYQWWLGTFPTGATETYFAAGYGGQFIFVLPEPEMVVVFTAGGFEDGNYDALLQIVNDYILPAAGIVN
jgi:CubicO group peptidase (beta-lactamase class C family)